MGELRKVDAEVRYIATWKPGLRSTEDDPRRLARSVYESFVEGPRIGPPPEVLTITVNGDVFTFDELWGET